MNINNIRRLLAYVVVVIIAFILWQTWMRDYPPASATTSKQATAIQASSASSSGQTKPYDAPPSYQPPASTSAAASATAPAQHKKVAVNQQSLTDVIHIKTDVLDLTVNLQGGSIIAAKLLKYPVSLQEKSIPVQLLTPKQTDYYVAQSGLTNTGTGSKGTAQLRYRAQQSQYTLQPGQSQLMVKLTATTANGLALVKTITLKRDDYAVVVNYQITNRSTKAWSGNLYTQLTRRQPSKASGHGLFYSHSYNGAAISSKATPYQKVTYKDMDQQNIQRNSQGGWVAMQQHYFLSAWVPSNQQQRYQYYTRALRSQNGGRNIYQIGFFSPTVTLAPQANASTHATLYVGPEIAKRLNALAPGLEHTINYGWLWPISIVIFWIMAAIHKVVGNWGWSIILTTIFIKIVFYWFSATSFRSMAKMREVQPRLKALKERLGDDRQALQKATMELYRKEKINPIGGCLPMLIQIPVFIALYYVLLESVQLRQAPFIFWIHDLSIRDPYYVLPILMGLSMFLQQKLTPSSPDPTQAKVMLVLPVIFTVVFINFPAGLVLYWLVNNCVQILQQWYVMKTYDKHKAKKQARRKGKKSLLDKLKK